MMSEFEYSRNLPFGQVLPGDSAVHRLDARARIVAFTWILTAVLFAASPWGLLLGLGLVVGGLRLARLSLGYTLRAVLSPLPFLLLLAALQVVWNALPDTGLVLVKLGSVWITPADLLAGVMLLLRFTALALELSFASQVLSISELAHGLDLLFAPLAKLKLPVHDAVMALVVAVRFLPFLAQSAERIAKAQAARGAQWTRAGGGLVGRARGLLPLLVPVFVTSLRRAETMAFAMDARGYASRGEQATAWVEMRFTRRDGIALALVGLAGVLILAL